MSETSRKKRLSGKKEAEPKRIVKEKASMPTGAPPAAVVEVRHDGRMMRRQASGYSRGEVAQAGLNFSLARRWGLLVDDGRRSVLDGNVASLKKWYPQTKKTTEERVEGEFRKIEKAVAKEVRKAEKEVKKEVGKAEKQIEKAGKGVESEAKKAEKEVEKVEKEVAEKVEAPLKKRSKKKATAKSETS